MIKHEKRAVTGVSRLSTLLGAWRYEEIATAGVYLVLVYVINLMFFFPFGDRYLSVVLLLASLLCLSYRKSISCWRAGSVKALLLPMLFYTLVLVTSYLINGGFMSSIRAFLYCSLFIYAASIVRLKIPYFAALCVLAAIEMVALVFYSCVWSDCERFGGFTNPIFLGMFSVCLAIVSVYLALAFERRWQRWSLYLCGAVFCMGAGLTLTRGAMLALPPVILIFTVYLYLHRRYSVRRALLGLLAATCLTAVVGVESGAFKRFAQVDEQLLPALSSNATGESYNSSIGFRILMWKYAFAVAMEHPGFGAGRERFQQYKSEWVEEGRFPAELIEYLPVGVHAHNQYLQELAMRGLVGFSALLALLIVPAVRFVRMIRSSDASAERAGYIGVSLVIAYITFSLTEVALKHPEKIAVFAVLGFIALRFGCLSREGEGQTT